MSWTQDLHELDALRRKVIRGDDEAVAAQRKDGLTARDRVTLLLDEGSFAEIGQLASQNPPSEAVVTGSGTIDGRPVFLFAQDYTVRSGSMSLAAARKIRRVLDLAVKTGAPVIGIYDSTGARLEDGPSALEAYGRILRRQSELSGVIPQLALVLGPCAGTAAFSPALADLIVVGGRGALFLAGPQVVAAKTGEASPAQIGGGEALLTGGLSHLSTKTEQEAIAAVRALIGFLPSNNLEDAPVTMADDLNRVLALDPEAAIDNRALLQTLLDTGTCMELQPGYSEAFTGLGRLGGYVCGVVATGGELTEESCEKIARFVRMCDAFNISVVTLTDAEGFAVKRHHAALVRAGAKLLFAYAEATVPKVTVVTGRAVGGSYLALGSHEMGADLTYAWPGAVISAMDPLAAAQIVFAEGIRKEENPIAARESFAQRYIAEYASAIVAEQKGLVDAVIDPAETRRMLIAALYMLESKRENRYPKKHGNAPM